MQFDSIDDAQRFYNDYAFKMGFGTRIAASINSQKKGPPTLIKRVFQCVHAGKQATLVEATSTSEGIAMEVGSSSKQAGVEMDMTSTRQRNRMLRHDCKARMIVGIQSNKWTITFFVQQYEVLQETMLDHEDNQAFLGQATTVPLYSRYNIERQAVNFYTRNVFGKFQHELTASIDYILNQVAAEELGSIKFELYSNYYEDPRVFLVNVMMTDEAYDCSCNCFEMNGIICAHIIRVMVHLNVQEISQCYLLERWSEAATTSMSGGGHLLNFGLPTKNTLKHNSLCRKLTLLASQACNNDVAYKILDDAAQQLEPIIAIAKRGALPEQQEEQQPHAAQQQPAAQPQAAHRQRQQ